jgi:hypothetical protein
MPGGGHNNTSYTSTDMTPKDDYGVIKGKLMQHFEFAKAHLIHVVEADANKIPTAPRRSNMAPDDKKFDDEAAARMIQSVANNLKPVTEEHANYQLQIRESNIENRSLGTHKPPQTDAYNKPLMYHGVKDNKYYIVLLNKGCMIQFKLFQQMNDTTETNEWRSIISRYNELGIEKSFELTPVTSLSSVGLHYFENNITSKIQDFARALHWDLTRVKPSNSGTHSTPEAIQLAIPKALNSREGRSTATEKPHEFRKPSVLPTHNAPSLIDGEVTMSDRGGHEGEQEKSEEGEGAAGGGGGGGENVVMGDGEGAAGGGGGGEGDGTEDAGAGGGGGGNRTENAAAGGNDAGTTAAVTGGEGTAAAGGDGVPPASGQRAGRVYKGRGNTAQGTGQFDGDVDRPAEPVRPSRSETVREITGVGPNGRRVRDEGEDYTEHDGRRRSQSKGRDGTAQDISQASNDGGGLKPRGRSASRRDEDEQNGTITPGGTRRFVRSKSAVRREREAAAAAGGAGAEAAGGDGGAVPGQGLPQGAHATLDLDDVLARLSLSI